MSDGLVKRLRICAAFDPDQAEAADRIEKLELVEKAYQQNQQTWSRNIARIEKLEEALREIANGQRDADKSYAELLAEVRIEARKALEGKDD